ncbi:dethiobiotin synthase [Actinoalloteichus caeruleus]|uniref:dethiobiotin synthase n=1 Tax=Actinoalloteichus cyanogriseus TaxID=2893586 RepID=UPI0004BF2FB7|nr:dethiobiotin synthase [Actinoalloteichus caeruleus]
MRLLVITGTDTGVGKTVVTAGVAALAAASGRRVAVLKAAQTGVAEDEPGDVDEVVRLAGAVTRRETARYPDPLAPATAARRRGLAPVSPSDVADLARSLSADHDLVLVEGAGGLLVRFDESGGLAETAAELAAPVLVVTRAGLGTLNHAALTVEALRGRGLRCAGLVVGEWPAHPDLACRENLRDLPLVTGVPLLGVLPTGCAGRSPADFLLAARDGLAGALGGRFTPKGITGPAGVGVAPGTAPTTPSEVEEPVQTRRPIL